MLQIVRAESFEEALALPSQHQYGNGVAIFTRNGRAARDFAARVNVGMVGINVPIPVPVAYHTFGGWKRSAFGDTNQHGMEGVRFCTKVKTVTARWPESTLEGGAPRTRPSSSRPCGELSESFPPCGGRMTRHAGPRRSGGAGPCRRIGGRERLIAWPLTPNRLPTPYPPRQNLRPLRGLRCARPRFAAALRAIANPRDATARLQRAALITPSPARGSKTRRSSHNLHGPLFELRRFYSRG